MISVSEELLDTAIFVIPHHKLLTQPPLDCRKLHISHAFGLDIVFFYSCYLYIISEFHQEILMLLEQIPTVQQITLRYVKFESVTF